jgi:hypothetical protein
MTNDAWNSISSYQKSLTIEMMIRLMNHIDDDFKLSPWIRYFWLNKKNGPQDPRVAITYEGLSEFGRSTSQSSFQAQQHHGNRISLFRGYRYMIISLSWCKRDIILCYICLSLGIYSVSLCFTMFHLFFVIYQPLGSVPGWAYFRLWWEQGRIECKGDQFC